MVENTEDKDFFFDTYWAKTILFFKKILRRFVTPFVIPSTIPKWLYKNKLQVAAGSFAIILITIYNVLPEGIFSFVKLLYPEIRNYPKDEQNHYKELFRLLSEHLIFALSVFSLLGHRIERWLGYKIKEAWRFNPAEYLLAVRKSEKEIRICETFIELLIVDYEELLKHSLDSFVKNCSRNSEIASIKILVLDPYCDAARDRIIKLHNYYRQKKLFRDIDKKDIDTFCNRFQDEIMHKYLIKLDGIRTRIEDDFNEKGKKIVKFEIRIFDIMPPYSLYYCDKYASFSYHKERPSTEYNQLIFLDTESDAAKFQLEPFDSVWDKATPLPLDYKTRPPRDTALLTKFKEINLKPDIESIYETLCEMAKKCRTDDHKIFDLIKFIEDNHQRRQIEKHYNIFGTGGDKDKTINITTISAILASHYSDDFIKSIPVKKVGTLAVTSAVGSQQFYDLLQSKLLRKDLIDGYEQVKNLDWLDFNRKNKSMYLPVTYFGYIYYDIIREARKRIDQDGILDIYKIIFPCADLTGYSAVINGVSNQNNVKYFEAVYSEFKKTGIIVNNQSKSIDEIFVGKTNLTYYRLGKKVHTEFVEIKIPNEKVAKYCEFFKESDSEKHINRFFELFHENTDIKIKETISYNVALLLRLYYLDLPDDQFDNDKFMDKKAMEKLMNKVFKFFFEK